MSKSSTKVARITPGAKFGFREVLNVTRTKVTYINTNGRPTRIVGTRPVHTVSKASFLRMIAQA